MPPEQSSSDPLLAALRAENAALRAQNATLHDELSQLRAAQAELARHLRITAPLRRIQETMRSRATRRRRDRREPASAVPGRSLAASRAAVLAATPAQLAAHPLLQHTAGQLAGDSADRAPDLAPVVNGRAGRVAVVAHVFYNELWPELAERIARIPRPIDLIVTLVEDRSELLADEIVAQFPDARLVIGANRGRDLWPFTRVLELGLIGDHDAVLKLHTKASVHRVDGDAWRRRLLDSLCPSPEQIGLILDLLDQDPGVGMIAPTGSVAGRELWGRNGLLVDALAVRAGVPIDPEHAWFAAGSMFWARPEPLLRLRAANLTIDDFEHEAISIDGTTAHALERFVGGLVGASGQDVLSADEVAGRLAAVVRRR